MNFFFSFGILLHNLMFIRKAVLRLKNFILTSNNELYIFKHCV